MYLVFKVEEKSKYGKKELLPLKVEALVE